MSLLDNAASYHCFTLTLALNQKYHYLDIQLFLYKYAIATLSTTFILLVSGALPFAYSLQRIQGFEAVSVILLIRHNTALPVS
jgi:hypothetical protein